MQASLKSSPGEKKCHGLFIPLRRVVSACQCKIPILGFKAVKKKKKEFLKEEQASKHDSTAVRT